MGWRGQTEEQHYRAFSLTRSAHVLVVADGGERNIRLMKQSKFIHDEIAEGIREKWAVHRVEEFRGQGVGPKLSQKPTTAPNGHDSNCRRSTSQQFINNPEVIANSDRGRTPLPHMTVTLNSGSWCVQALMASSAIPRLFSFAFVFLLFLLFWNMLIESTEALLSSKEMNLCERVWKLLAKMF